jgi:hypothetical protein
MSATQGDETLDEQPGYDKTISGMGTWTGLVDVAREVREEFGQPEDLAVVDRLDRQVARYEWFVGRVEQTRKVERLAMVLAHPPREPSQWERAMVELSLDGSAKAQVVLEHRELPEEELDLELFRRVCVAKCG